MPSTSNTNRSKKQLASRYDFALKTTGRINANVSLEQDRFTRISGRPPQGDTREYVYVDPYWYRFSATSSNSYSTRKNQGWKSAKRFSKVNPLTQLRAPNPFNLTLMEFDEGKGSGTLLSGTTYTRYRGGFPDLVNLNWNLGRWVNMTNGDIISDLNAINRAQTETLVKLKDMKVNFGEALAEARSTFHHLASTFRTVLSAYNYAKKGKWAKLLKELKINKRHKWSTKDPAGRWLEVQFGWTPLISDIKGLFELSQSKLKTNKMIISAERNLVSSYSNENICSLPTQRYSDSQALFTGTRGVAVKLYATVRDEDIANLTSLGLTDPLQVAWALVPFSFLVDWALPIGSFLEALGATKGLTFQSGTRTEFINGSLKITANYTTTTEKGDGLWEKNGQLLCVRRSVYTGFPAPLPYAKSPLSTSHIVSALALFRTIAFKR